MGAGKPGCQADGGWKTSGLWREPEMRATRGGASFPAEGGDIRAPYQSERAARQSRQAQASCEPDSGSGVAGDISAVAFHDMDVFRGECMARECMS